MKRDFNFKKASNDVQYMLDTVLEVKTLLGYKDDSMLEMNRTRYLSDLDQIIEIAKELKKLN